MEKSYGRRNWYGWITAAVAVPILWASGLRPFVHAISAPPLDIQIAEEEKDGRPKAWLTAKNTSDATLCDVAILGFGGNGSMRIQRRGAWAPGEIIDLGAREGWISEKDSQIEISAAGHRTKKLVY
jgi:hypothetical protein